MIYRPTSGDFGRNDPYIIGQRNDGDGDHHGAAGTFLELNYLRLHTYISSRTVAMHSCVTFILHQSKQRGFDTFSDEGRVMIEETISLVR